MFSHFYKITFIPSKWSFSCRIHLARRPSASNSNSSIFSSKAFTLTLEELSNKNLSAYKNLNALQTVGYAELFDYLDNKITLQDAIERIKISTRQYAKRQLTWFKKDSDISWFHPDNLNEIINHTT